MTVSSQDTSGKDANTNECYADCASSIMAQNTVLLKPIGVVNLILAV